MIRWSIKVGIKKDEARAFFFFLEPPQRQEAHVVGPVHVELFGHDSRLTWPPNFR